MKIKIIALTLFAIILINCEIKPTSAIAQTSKPTDNSNVSRNRYKHKIFYLQGDQVTKVIQPWLDLGWHVESVTAEVVSFERRGTTDPSHIRGNFVIVLTEN